MGEVYRARDTKLTRDVALKILPGGIRAPCRPGPRIPVSPNGGNSAHWRRDGRELFYLAPDGTLMAVPVRAVPSIEFGKSVPLFQFFNAQNRGVPAQRSAYDVTADGQRFIVSAVVRRSDPSINVVLNWPALLTK